MCCRLVTSTRYSKPQPKAAAVHIPTAVSSDVTDVSDVTDDGTATAAGHTELHNAASSIAITASDTETLMPKSGSDGVHRTLCCCMGRTHDRYTAVDVEDGRKWADEEPDIKVRANLFNYNAVLQIDYCVCMCVCSRGLAM